MAQLFGAFVEDAGQYRIRLRAPGGSYCQYAMRRKPTLEDRHESAKKLIQLRIHALLLLRRRYAGTVAIMEEGQRQAQGRDFQVRNDLLWRMYWESYQLQIVDAAALLKSIVRPQGLLTKLEHYLGLMRPGIHGPRTLASDPLFAGPDELSPEQEREIANDMTNFLRQSTEDRATEARVRLFPGIGKDGKVTGPHLKALGQRLKQQFHELVQDRHKIAHRGDKPERFEVLTTSVRGLGDWLQQIQDVLRDLQHVTLGAASSFPPMRISKLGDVARDFIDQVLNGTVNELVYAAMDSGRLDYQEQREARGPALKLALFREHKPEGEPGG